MKIKKIVVSSIFCFFNFELSVLNIVVTIIKLTVYMLDSYFWYLGVNK